VTVDVLLERGLGGGRGCLELVDQSTGSLEIAGATGVLELLADRGQARSAEGGAGAFQVVGLLADAMILPCSSSSTAYWFLPSLAASSIVRSLTVWPE
jgi:hypothetical protein